MGRTLRNLAFASGRRPLWLSCPQFTRSGNGTAVQARCASTRKIAEYPEGGIGTFSEPGSLRDGLQVHSCAAQVDAPTFDDTAQASGRGRQQQTLGRGDIPMVGPRFIDCSW